MFAFAATAHAVSDHHFDAVYDAYLGDQEVQDFLQENNPAAAREMAERLLEAQERGLWKPRSNAAGRHLAILGRAYCGASRMIDRADDDEINERANEKARKKKAARDKMLATKTIEKGLLIVHTGKGKGQIDSRVRVGCASHRQWLKVGIVQYVKGKWETGERVSFWKRSRIR